MNTPVSALSQISLLSPDDAWWTQVPNQPVARSYHELFYVVQGTLPILELEGHQRKLHARELAYIPPQTPRMTGAAGRKNLVFICVQWNETGDWNSRKRERFSMDGSGRLLMLLRWMLELYSTPKQFPELANQLLAALILSGLESNIRVQEDAMDRVMKFLRVHFTRRIKLEHLEPVARTGSRNIQRLFKERFGSSPAQYILKLRLEMAVNLLRETDTPVKQVALQTGIADPAHLHRLLVREYGQTPGQLRKNNLI